MSRFQFIMKRNFIHSRLSHVKDFENHPGPLRYTAWDTKARMQSWAPERCHMGHQDDVQSLSAEECRTRHQGENVFLACWKVLHGTSRREYNHGLLKDATGTPRWCTITIYWTMFHETPRRECNNDLLKDASLDTKQRIHPWCLERCHMGRQDDVQSLSAETPRKDWSTSMSQTMECPTSQPLW
jgi:hypothetical protein